MATFEFSDEAIAALPDYGSARNYTDSKDCGLTCRVRASGKRTLYFCHQRGARRVWTWLGRWPDLGVEEARDLARKYRRTLDAGKRVTREASIRSEWILARNHRLLLSFEWIGPHHVSAKHCPRCACRRGAVRLHGIGLPADRTAFPETRAIYLAQRWIDVSLPSCRVIPNMGPVKMVLQAVAADLGWRCGTSAESRPVWVQGNRELATEWELVVREVAPMAHGGSGGSVWLYRSRDLLGAFAKRVPRLRCSCGKLLPRHAREIPKQHTYLVSDAPYLKIGRTVDVQRRFKNGVSTDNPRPLHLLAQLCGNQEAELHERFARYRVRGEWFKDVPSIRQAFGVGVPVEPNQAQLALPDLSWQEVYA